MFAITKRYSHALTLARQSVRSFTTFEQGDFCMLRQVKTNKKFFIGPLEETGERGMKGGNISHDNIIGKKPRSIIRTSNEKDMIGYMAHFPTLEEFVVNVPRACTPIYPKDASTIVQMLDLEPGHRVLEAGTGNGSLTLYMARAVAGGGDSIGHIDSFDIRESHSNTARKHIERYARGRYQPIVKLHIGAVADTLPQLMEPAEQYDAIALDMPEPCDQIPRLLPFLRNDRFLVCYLPNMTQVLALAELIIDLPLVMEDCIEAEWKEWEVRATHIKHRLKKIAEGEEDTVPTDAWVCRPKNFDVKGHTAFLVKLRKSAAVL
ncbi:S-adenosyl-L-methionine-dependent methyltransferase [Helicostylum pulchrum]|nr:S-adenosyl-L-methionine-dependent methyltransferase [Helicostylum pulchrum]